MSDNRTTELRAKLTEQGVKWWPMCNNGYYEERDTEFVANGKKHTAHEWGDGLAVYNLTPEQAIAATLGSGKLTAEQVRKAVNSHGNIMDNRLYENWQAVADELNAALGGGECKIIASSTDGLTSDEPKQWFELSCGHTFKIYGLDVPVACPVCGRKVKR